MEWTLKDRRAVVTGASRGLGKAVAEAFVRAGASVLLTARGAEELTAARAAMAKLASGKQVVEALAGDAADEAHAREIAKAVARLPGGTTVLVNNAAVLGPVGLFDESNFAQWADALRVNLLGPALMSHALIPLMRKQGGGKIINLSGGGATGSRPRFSAYAAAKTGVVRLTETLADELREAKIDVTAVAPGAMNTQMLEDLLKAGPNAAGGEFARSQKQLAEGGVPPEKSAELIVFLASAASDGLSGRLISAVWDDWRSFADPQKRDQLARSDVYTLRRIVPKDRGWPD